MNAHNAPLPTVTHTQQRAQDPWATLVQIWRNEYPPEAPRVESFSLAVKLAVTPVLIARRLSPSSLLRKQSPDVIDGMVIAWTALSFSLAGSLSDRTGSLVPLCCPFPMRGSG